MGAETIDVSLVVPCFNEAGRIDTLLESVAAWRASRPAGEAVELVLVDDGSTDGTGARLARAAEDDARLRVVSLVSNEGKGAALRRGIAVCRGLRVVTMDADLAVRPTHLGALLAALGNGADVAVGSRNADGGGVAHPQPRLRRWLGRRYLGLSRRWLALPVDDVTCGFKGYRADVARALFPATRCRRWGIDAELLFLARRGGYAIQTVPVVWSDGGQSAVRLHRDVLLSLGELVAIRWRGWRAGVAPSTPTSRGRASHDAAR